MNLIKQYQQSKAYKEGITFGFIFSRIFLLAVFMYSYSYVSQFESCTIDYYEHTIECKDILYREEGFSFNSFYYIVDVTGQKRITAEEFYQRIEKIRLQQINGNINLNLNLNLTNGN